MEAQIVDILDKLATEKNFGDIINLSKIFSDINLDRYMYLCPSINVSASKIVYDSGAGYSAHNITMLKHFKLKNDDTLYTDKTHFLQNLNNVEMLHFRYDIYVTSGEFYEGIENFRSIEFDLHKIKGPAKIISYNKRLEDTPVYALHGKILTLKTHEKLIRDMKISNLNGDNKSLPALLKTMELKLMEKRDKEIAQKKLEKQNSVNIEWTTFTIDKNTTFLA